MWFWPTQSMLLNMAFNRREEDHQRQVVPEMKFAINKQACTYSDINFKAKKRCWILWSGRGQLRKERGELRKSRSFLMVHTSPAWIWKGRYFVFCTIQWSEAEPHMHRLLEKQRKGEEKWFRCRLALHEHCDPDPSSLHTGMFNYVWFD
jgi:hypothetical protein